MLEKRGRVSWNKAESKEAAGVGMGFMGWLAFRGPLFPAPSLQLRSPAPHFPPAIGSLAYRRRGNSPLLFRGKEPIASLELPFYSLETCRPFFYFWEKALNCSWSPGTTLPTWRENNPKKHV